MNNISFVGNIVADAQVRQAGQKNVINLRVADNVGFGDKKVTNFFDVSSFRNANSEKFVNILTKGSKVFISGEFKTRNWKSKEGEDRVSLDVMANEISLVGDGKPSENNSTASSSAPAAQSRPEYQAAASAPESDEDPF